MAIADDGAAVGAARGLLADQGVAEDLPWRSTVVQGEAGGWVVRTWTRTSPGAARPSGTPDYSNGALLGMGFTSRLGTWLWYLIPLASFVTADAVQGAVIYGIYGAVRMALPAGLASWAMRHPDTDVSASVIRHRRYAVAAADAAFVVSASMVLVALL